MDQMIKGGVADLEIAHIVAAGAEGHDPQAGEAAFGLPPQSIGHLEYGAVSAHGKDPVKS